MRILYEVCGYRTAPYDAAGERMRFGKIERAREWAAAYLAAPGRKVVCRRLEPARGGRWLRRCVVFREAS